MLMSPNRPTKLLMALGPGGMRGYNITMTNNESPLRLTDFDAFDRDGKLLAKGDRITDFRGDHDRFLGVAANPIPGKSGKVRTARGVYYDTVFGITIRLRD